jgi:hypothetical protein
MKEVKMTVRIPLELLEKAKKFAAANDTTLTALIRGYLKRITAQQLLNKCAGGTAF